MLFHKAYLQLLISKLILNQGKLLQQIHLHLILNEILLMLFLPHEQINVQCYGKKKQHHNYFFQHLKDSEEILVNF